MANHDLSLEQKRDSPFFQNQHLGGADVASCQGHDFDSEQTHEHHLDLGQNNDHGLDFDNDHDRELFLDRELTLPNSENHADERENGYDHVDKHENGFVHENKHENGYNYGGEYENGYRHGNEHYTTGYDLENGNGNELETAEENGPDMNGHDACTGGPQDLQLVVPAESQEFDLSGNHELHENMDLVAHQETDDMGISPAPVMCIPQPQLVMSTPIIQCRTAALSPTYELAVGQEFPDVKSCRRALRDTAIALHFEIQTVKSDKTRFTAKCASEGCPWRIHAAKLPGVPTFTIRTIHAEHSCGGISHLGHQQASVEWVASSVEERLKENPNCKPKEILEEIHRVHGITLSYKQAWRGKERIMAALRGSFEEDYRLLPQYCDQITRTNPGSIASVYVNPADSCFQRLFVSFHASIYGFVNACRPLLGLDRTVLKSKYLGTLLLATSFDGDGALFPLAFGVVDEENDDNWMWFLSELHNLLVVNTENMPKLTILSDRQKSIVDAVEANFPTAFHGFCMHHLAESFRKEFSNTILVNYLWEAASALTPQEFEGKILEIEEVSPEAAYWLRRVPARLWATAYFEGTRFGHLTANTAESLNTWILEASGLPIIQMMECIRRHLMTLFSERREASAQWASILVPYAERFLSEAHDRQHSYQVLRANEAEFEVISHEGTHIVDIRNRLCQCRGWQSLGLPCSHGVAALRSCKQNAQRFTDSCFTVVNYRKAYSETLHPIPDRTLWKDTSDESQVVEYSALSIAINPPKSLRPPGRPRKRRIRAEDQGRSKRVVHCSRCNQTGHFRTTCSAPI